MTSKRKTALIAFLVALVFSGLFLYAAELITWGHWYSSHFTYRQQTEALMTGHLSLFEDPGRLAYDYTYFFGKANQVWGLGVPLLRLPFELLAHGMFPDRITLGLYFALMGAAMFGLFISLLRRYGPPFSRQYYLSAATLLTFCVMFMTPIFSLARTMFVVYEEAVLYAITVSLLLFVSGFRVRSHKLAYLLAFASGFACAMRPTVFAYGFATLCILIYRFKPQRKQLVGFVALFMLGVGLVGYTNYLRFGSFTEFGHGINLDTLALNNYDLKFTNQYASTPFPAAATELLGGIFFNNKPLATHTPFLPNMVSGQASELRWRDFYSSNFTPVHFAMFVISIGLVALAAIHYRKYRSLEKFFIPAESIAMLSFGLISFAGLFAFYLHSPSLSSRYVDDFTGSIVVLSIGLFTAGIYLLTKKYPAAKARTSITVIILCLLAVTLFSIIQEYKKPKVDSTNLTASEVRAMFYQQTRVNAPIGRRYDLGEVVRRYGFFNGAGWDSTSGSIAPVVLFFMQNIGGSIKLTLQGSCSIVSDTSMKIKIGLDYLTPTVTHNKNLTTASFAVPKKYQSSTQWPVFIKFYDVKDANTLETGCRLLNTAW